MKNRSPLYSVFQRAPLWVVSLALALGLGAEFGRPGHHVHGNGERQLHHHHFFLGDHDHGGHGAQDHGHDERDDLQVAAADNPRIDGWPRHWHRAPASEPDTAADPRHPHAGAAATASPDDDPRAPRPTPDGGDSPSSSFLIDALWSESAAPLTGVLSALAPAAETQAPRAPRAPTSLLTRPSRARAPPAASFA